MHGANQGCLHHERPSARDAQTPQIGTDHSEAFFYQNRPHSTFASDRAGGGGVSVGGEASVVDEEGLAGFYPPTKSEYEKIPA